MKSKLESAFEEMIAWVAAAGIIYSVVRMITWFIQQAASS